MSQQRQVAVRECGILVHRRWVRTGTVLSLLVACAAAHRQCRAADNEEEKVLPPQEVTLSTGDGVTIVASYYPSKLKQAVPVILLHASKGSRGDVEELALKLQRAGHAVIAPDLRGHGDSSRAADRTGEMRPEDYRGIVDRHGDLEAVKRYLIDRNNAGEVNIEKLCLVGVEMGAVMALNWAALDWSWEVLASGKQGQDVKALVLVSPEWSFKGLRINEAVAHPNVRADLSVLIVAGKGNSKLLKEAKRLHNAFEKFHPASTANPDTATLLLKTPQTSLQATRLLNEKSLHVHEMVLKFIDARLAKQHMPWSERKAPL